MGQAPGGGGRTGGSPSEEEVDQLEVSLDTSFAFWGSAGLLIGIEYLSSS